MAILMCHLCRNKIDVKEDYIRREDIFGSCVQNDDSTFLSVLKCKHCEKDVGILLNDSWVCVDEALHQPDVADGIYQVKDHSERVTLYILNKICHNQYDLNPELEESPFICHSRNEQAWLLWKNNEAIGFYTTRNKGDQLYDMPYCRYSLTVLDTIYIRQHFRHQGYGKQLIRHFLDRHSGEDVGFSAPLSNTLLRVQLYNLWMKEPSVYKMSVGQDSEEDGGKSSFQELVKSMTYLDVYHSIHAHERSKVLHRMLLTDGKLRDHVWECSYDGSEGYRRNVWLHCKTIFKSREV